MAEVPAMAERVLPIVKLFCPCGEVRSDKEDGMALVKNPHFTAQMPDGITRNMEVEELWLFALVTDGIGDFNLVVEMYNEEGVQVARSLPVPRHFPGGGQLDEVELFFSLRDIPIAEPGVYQFKLLADNQETEGGTADLRILPGEV
jgi:hypothetical protein